MLAGIEGLTVPQTWLHHKPGHSMISWEEFSNGQLGFEFFSCLQHIGETEQLVIQIPVPELLLVLYWFYEEGVWTVQLYLSLLHSIPL